ncbi:MAG: HEPN domain-containing protein [Chitinophagaceae bacterium]
MKASLSHLPENKQTEIQNIKEIIKEVINPEMIILFGSYAKGTYVENRYAVAGGPVYEYISDYDFLVVTKENTEKTHHWENLILNELVKIKPPINLEIHEESYINKGLELGEYFFVDIVHEGITLIDRGTVTFAKPRILTGSEKQGKAERYFQTWFPQAVNLLKTARFNFSEGDYKIGVFLLHQAVESLYNATLLVFTDYKHKIHNLWKLRKKTKHLSEELFQVFKPETDNHEEHLFDLLKRGYIDARYMTDYVIIKEELGELIERVSKMVKIVEDLCTDTISKTV